MRRDMTKVIVTRPRRGSSRKNPDVLSSRSSSDFESLPKRSSMRPRTFHWSSSKSQTDHLSPLLRFLFSRVGHSWNKVYSEISSAVDRRHLMGFHLEDHIKDFVDTSPIYYEDGSPYHSRFAFPIYYPFFFVDKKGALRQSTLRRPLYSPELPPFKEIDGNFYFFRKTDSLWFQIEFFFFKDFFSPEYLSARSLGARLKPKWLVVPYSHTNRRVLYRIRSLSKKQKKRLGLF